MFLEPFTELSGCGQMNMQNWRWLAEVSLIGLVPPSGSAVAMRGSACSVLVSSFRDDR